MGQINNYFTSKLREYNGDANFTKYLRPEDIQRSAKDRILKEMARGRIDYTKYGKYFTEDSKFLENVYIVAKTEYENSSAILLALKFYDLSCPGNLLVVRNLYRYNNINYMYSVLASRLGRLRETGDIGVLADIQFILKDAIKFI